MWKIEDQTQETLREMLQEMPSCYLISGASGEIYWANSAFLQWSGYSSIGELQKTGWQKLSVEGADLQADLEAASEMRRGVVREYTISKQYIPKGGKPEWGQLFVQRKPAIGEFQFAVCCWSPLKNGTATAFSLAMERCEKIQEQIKEMNQHISTLTTRTEEENWINSSIRMCMKHPRMALGLLVLMLSVFGLNNVLELFSKVGLVHLPAVEQKAAQKTTHVEYDGPRWVAVGNK